MKPLSSVLLLIPPLTQLNTPYPATAYLKGFLDEKKIPCRQGDAGLDMVLALFNKQGLIHLFDAIEAGNYELKPALKNILLQRKAYEETIDSVILFLQNKNYTLGYRIATRQFLPEASRFKTLNELELFFGEIGTHDKARYLCTMYLEDLSDLIQATVGPHFGFSKYAERIARTAVNFSPIEEALNEPTTYLDRLLLDATAKYFEEEIPILVGLTVPFGGNLYGALKIGQWVKANYPQTKVALGGGYANTELRDLYDPRVFDYVDYICLDDGEATIMAIYDSLTLDLKEPLLKRTFIRSEGKVIFLDNKIGGDFLHAQLPAPSYHGLRLDEYLSMFDVPNPMHRLWNDGRWNKLTVAHGCYWKKCSFCDVTLDYIARYENTPASKLVDKMEKLIAETGETGFHFVDEAAPPLALRDLAIEILRRNLQVTWWTNIRFEKTFTEDLCKLLAASGCIAVTGGLEVASQRLLDLMEKGITIEQVARVTKGFRDAGILVHAYLMYGFPTETEQETIDSLEIVRQLFEAGLLQSGFWHQFAMTVHSPVGKEPEKYKVVRIGPEFEGFANNDLYHEDPTGADHDRYSAGLKKALYNYMHRNGFDFPLGKFFDFKIPNTTVPNKLISKHIKKPLPDLPGMSGYVFCWHQTEVVSLKSEKGNTELIFVHKKGHRKVLLPEAIAAYIVSNKPRFELFSEQPIVYSEVMEEWGSLLSLPFDELTRATWYLQLREGIIWLLKK